MADTKVVNIKIEHNADKATQSANNLTSALNNTSKSATELSSKTDSLNKMQGAIDAVGSAVGGLNPAFGGAIKGANGLIIKMWEMVANPIGAILAGIVITVKFLYEAFQSSVAGGKELKAMFAAISAVGTQVKDAIFALGRAVLDVYEGVFKLITLDFSGAMESFGNASKEATTGLKQLGDAATTTYKKMYELEKAQQANDKAKKEASVETAKANKLLVQSRDILTDETASIKDKKKALEEVTRIETAASLERERIAKEDLRIAKEKAKTLGGEEEKKAKQEIRELTIAVYEAEQETAQNGIKLNRQRRMLAKQEAAEKKEELDAEKERQKEAADAYKKKLDEQKKAFEEHQKSINDLIKKYNDDLQNLNAKTEQEKLDLQRERDLEEINRIAKNQNEKANLMALFNEKYFTLQNELNDKLKSEQDKKTQDKLNGYIAELDALDAEDEKKAKKELARQEAVEAAKKSLINNGFQLITELAGKGSKIGKAVAIAQTTMATIEGVQNAFKTAQKSPITAGFPAYPYIQAGLAGAFGALQISKIKSVDETGAGGGSGNAGSAPSIGGASAPAAPTFNVVGNAGVNQIAGVMAQQGMQPIQAYVVASNVTTAQALNRNIVNNATLG